MKNSISWRHYFVDESLILQRLDLLESAGEIETGLLVPCLCLRVIVASNRFAATTTLETLNVSEAVVNGERCSWIDIHKCDHHKFNMCRRQALRENLHQLDVRSARVATHSPNISMNSRIDIVLFINEMFQQFHIFFSETPGELVDKMWKFDVISCGDIERVLDIDDIIMGTQIAGEFHQSNTARNHDRTSEVESNQWMDSEKFQREQFLLGDVEHVIGAFSLAFAQI